MDGKEGVVRTLAKLPKDSSSRVICETAEGILHNLLPKEHWTYHGLTGTDHGNDCDIELVENEEYSNKHIYGQIKGTMSPTFLRNGDISFSLDLSVVNYGLSSATPYVLFVVDVMKEIVYYLPVQDYFIANTELFEKSGSEQEKMALHLSTDSTIPKDDYELCQIAKSVYVDGPGREIKKIR